MSEYTIDIDDGLAQTMENNLPEEITVEDWLVMQVEQAIAETHLQQKQQSIQQKAAMAQQAEE